MDGRFRKRKRIKAAERHNEAIETNDSFNASITLFLGGGGTTWPKRGAKSFKFSQEIESKANQNSGRELQQESSRISQVRCSKCPRISEKNPFKEFDQITVSIKEC